MAIMTKELHEKSWMLLAANLTLQHFGEGLLEGDLSKTHCQEIYDYMENNLNEMSPAKIGRWLGWMQAAACASGGIGLEDLKELNRQCSHDWVKQPGEDISEGIYI